MRTPEELAAQNLARQTRYRQRLESAGGRVRTFALSADGVTALEHLTRIRGLSQSAIVCDALVRLAELYPEAGPDC